MCGLIAGYTPKIEHEKISNALLSLFHRGNEESQIIYFDNHFLGHCRLRVTGIKNGTQPLFNHDKTLWAVVNGEFYNYKKIRTELEKKQHKFLTDTDSELIIHLYQEYGLKSLDYLEGEFAFCLFDTKKKLWLIGRDPFGVRPLHYLINSSTGQFLCSSEAKALLPFTSRKLNLDTLAFSQSFQYSPIGASFFKDIHLLPPGHFAIVQSNQVQLHKYWELPVGSQSMTMSFEQAQEKLYFYLNQAIVKRLPVEVKPCIHLSGGLDSSIIAGLVSQRHPSLQAFNVSFENAHYDEKILAQKTANLLGIQLSSIMVTHQDMLDFLPQAVFMGEGLAINGHLSSKYLLNKYIHAQGFKVALTGEGSDEFALGYTHLREDAGFKKPTSHLNLGGVHTPRNLSGFSDIEKIMGFVPTWVKAKLELGKIWQKLFTQVHTSEDLLYKNLMVYHPQWNLINSPERKSSSSWIYYGLSSYILKTLDDGMGMAHQVESRLPFLDKDVVNFLHQVPTDYLVHEKDKFLLRETFKTILHPEVYQKNKQPFMAPPLTICLNNKKQKKQIEQYLQPLFEKNLYQMEAWQDFCQKATLNEENMIAFEPILFLSMTLAQLIEQFNLEVDL